MVDIQAFSDDLTPEQEKLIAALLTEKTKRAAAKKVYVSENTMYRWFRDPVFKTAYRAARRISFEDAIAIIEVAAPEAAQVLARGLGKKAKINSDKIKLALAVIDRAFAAHQHIGIEIELDRLRQKEERLTALMASAPPAIKTRKLSCQTMNRARPIGCASSGWA